MHVLKTSVGTAAQKVALLKQKQDEANKALARGDMSASGYKKIEIAVLRAQNQLQGFNNEIAKTQKMFKSALKLLWILTKTTLKQSKNSRI